MHTAALRKSSLHTTHLSSCYVIFLASPRARESKAELLKLHGRRQFCFLDQGVPELSRHLFPRSRASTVGAEE